MNLIEELEKQQKISDKRQIRGAFIRQLSQIADGFEDYWSLSEILHTILNKNGDKQNSYDWEDSKLLKKTESVYKSMIKEAQEQPYDKR